MLKDIHNSKTVRGVIIGLGIAILVLGIFKLGMVAGYHKATFSEKFGNNFERNFRDPKGSGFMQMGIPMGADLPGGHGAVGEIVSIALPLIVVAGPDNLEKTVVVTKTTEIREFRDTIKANELIVGDFIIVLGNPNDGGQIDAKLIRLAPSLPNISEEQIKQ